MKASELKESLIKFSEKRIQDEYLNYRSNLKKDTGVKDFILTSVQNLVGDKVDLIAENNNFFNKNEDHGVSHLLIKTKCENQEIFIKASIGYNYADFDFDSDWFLTFKLYTQFDLIRLKNELIEQLENNPRKIVEKILTEQSLL